MKQIAILGSTGSIGQNTLEVIRRFPGEFRVAALSTNKNIGLLQEQIKQFSPQVVCVTDRQASLKLKPNLKPGVKLLTGEEGLVKLCSHSAIDQVMVAVSGSSALLPLLTAIDKGKGIALANKEALVMAGNVIMQKAIDKNVRILPVDSEQSAIWQCLQGNDKNKIGKIYLTASGGPFRKLTSGQLRRVSVRDALRHPRWKMGKKITVDSATLMNKGLEVLEAVHLFATPADKIKVVVHPESIIHSMVEFIDGVIMAQLSATDMRIPIQYALSYPDRLPGELPALDFASLKNLNFENPDLKRFPCLALAFEAAYAGGTAPCVLNAANEVCVEGFLRQKLNFLGIPKIIERVLSKSRNIKQPSLTDILNLDAWSREEAKRVIAGN